MQKVQARWNIMKSLLQQKKKFCTANSIWRIYCFQKVDDRCNILWNQGGCYSEISAFSKLLKKYSFNCKKACATFIYFEMFAVWTMLMMAKHCREMYVEQLRKGVTNILQGKLAPSTVRYCTNNFLDRLQFWLPPVDQKHTIDVRYHFYPEK